MAGRWLHAHRRREPGNLSRDRLRQVPVSDRWLQHAIRAPGYVFGLPTGQAAGTAQFLADVAGGQEDPQSLAG